ncbi:MAG: hypothetical protein IT450_18480 [Phycisphaerales bacterium]|nr:hypothetical protein [Phycisphaerales bacterium]
MTLRFSLLRRPCIAAWLVFILIPLEAPAGADDAAIQEQIRTFFAAGDPAARRAAAEAIAADAAFSPKTFSTQLHRAGLFKPLEAGRTTIQSGPGDVKSLAITLRIPKEYDPATPWPLIYALHGTGGDGESIIQYVERVLGDRVEQFVIAAPSGYEQMELKGSPTYTREHVIAINDIRRTVHVDSDRIFATGYSRGGHAAWTLAIVNPDLFAGVMPLAGTLLIPEYDVLFAEFLPNAAHTRVLCCWGEQDVGGPGGGKSATGGIAAVNQLIRRLAEEKKLAFEMIEAAGKGHGDITPPRDALTTWLEGRRTRAPKKFEHTFRLLEQGAAYWLEPLEWTGKQWGDEPVKIEFKPGEKDWDTATQRQALARAIRPMLGELGGEISGQQIRVSRKNVKSLVVWIGEDAIDWSKKVTLKVSGMAAFSGELKPDVLLCLSEAAVTYDFDRLRWAGLKYVSGKKATILSGDEAFRP